MNARHHTWLHHSGPVVAERHGGTVIACEACGYRHVVPLPEGEDTRRLYTEEFYDQRHQAYIADHERDRAWRQLEFKAKYDLCESLLGPARRRLLDVGSGPGHFLEYGMARGWQVVGVEPSPAACLHARQKLGCTVIEGFFTPATVAEVGPVDVVHLNNVLEHVPDPAALLDTTAGLLAPGGLICISVPNDFNPLQEALVRLRGHERWWVEPREHVNYFDRASLEALLARHGFAARRWLASFPLELFALMGEDYIADPALGSVIHGRRKALELALDEAGCADLLAEMYGRLGDMGLGRILTVAGEKVESAS